MTTSDIQLPGIEELAALARTYFDAAHDMDANKFASIFHEAAFVTRKGENDTVIVTPVAAWLDIVRTLKSPRESGAERKDQILSINLVRDMALIKISLLIPPREVTDLLSCFFLNGRWLIVQKVFNAEPIR